MSPLKAVTHQPDYSHLCRRVDAVEARTGLMIAGGETQRERIKGLRTELAALARVVDSVAGELEALGQVVDDLASWRQRREAERAPATGPEARAR